MDDLGPDRVCARHRGNPLPPIKFYRAPAGKPGKDKRLFNICNKCSKINRANYLKRISNPQPKVKKVVIADKVNEIIIPEKTLINRLLSTKLVGEPNVRN